MYAEINCQISKSLAFWLWSCVVTVLIHLTMYWLPRKSFVNLLFASRGCLLCLHNAPQAWSWHFTRRLDSCIPFSHTNPLNLIPPPFHPNDTRHHRVSYVNVQILIIQTGTKRRRSTVVVFRCIGISARLLAVTVYPPLPKAVVLRLSRVRKVTYPYLCWSSSLFDFTIF